MGCNITDVYSAHQGQPGCLGAGHAVSLGPGTEERGTRGRVEAHEGHGRKRQEGPVGGDRGHCEFRKEKVFRFPEESWPGGRELLSGGDAAVGELSLGRLKLGLY